MKKGTKRIGSSLMLAGAVLSGAACSPGKEAPKKDTKPTLSTDQKLALTGADLVTRYLETSSAGSSVSAKQDQNAGEGLNGGYFGSEDVCTVVWNNKHEIIKEDEGSAEAMVKVDVDKDGDETIYITAVDALDDNTFVDGTVVIEGTSQDCNLPNSPEEIQQEIRRLVSESGTNVTFQRNMEITENPQAAIDGLREATK